MGIFEVVKSLLSSYKKIDPKILPSQGYFYPEDFHISIKKSDVEDIIEYEENYDSENIYLLISNIKKIVEKNTKLPSKYTYADIKSVDLVFLFLEIVKLTKNKNIKFSYFDDTSGKVDIINFDSSTFNYFDYDQYQDCYDSEKREFLIDDYSVSLPTIGAEDSLTNYLMSKSELPDADKWNHYSYDFLYLLGNKSNLSFKEIDNLITIFNEDLPTDEQEKISNIVKKFSDMIGYSIKKGDKLIDLRSKIDLANIWKD